MSGIGGIVGYKTSEDAANLICGGLVSALSLRGASFSNTYVSEEASLVNTSSDDVQIVHAAQGDKRYVLVCDGELYNKEEIIKLLDDAGIKFQGLDDATVIMNGYMAWGAKCLEFFNGVFAFALWDGEKLFMARDRLGLRPLYYTIGAFGLVFASSIKGLLSHPQVRAVINAEGAAEVLLIGPGKTPGCGVFKGFCELEPANFAVYCEGKITQTPYWKIKAKPHTENFEETAEIVKAILTDAIKRQSPANKPIATLLSGGLDSSAVAALSKSTESFSVDYVGNDEYFNPSIFQPEGDGKYINQMATYLNLNHRHIILDSKALANTLAEAAAARGLPGMADVDSSLLLFLKEVKMESDFAFSGEGADEIFGGYRWYQKDNLLYSNTFPWSQSAEYRYKFLSPMLAKKINPLEYVNSRFEKTLNEADTLATDDPRENRLRQMYMLNLRWFLQTLATRNDTMSAAAGVTVRAPFLDYRLVEYLYNVPWQYKNFMGREKGLLRAALKGVLPKEVLWRKKSPFPKTHNPAYLTLVRDMLMAMDSNSPIFSLVSKNAIEMLLNQDSGINWYGQLMAYPQTIAYFLQVNALMKDYSVTIQ